jgi:hypothetical protein
MWSDVKKSALWGLAANLIFDWFSFPPKYAQIARS